MRLPIQIKVSLSRRQTKSLGYRAIILLVMMVDVGFSLMSLTSIGNPPRASAAGSSGTVRQEINILDSTYTATNTTISSTEFSQLDPTKYSDTTTYYFEVVASATASSSGSIHLRRQGTSTDDTTIAFSSLGTTAGRVRSAAFTAPGSATEYFIYADAGGASKTVTIKAARIIAIQVSSPMTSTQTQIEIGSKATGLTNASSAALTNPKYWYYRSASWDNSPSFYAEATYKATSATLVIKLQEDDGSFGSWSDKVTIVTSSSSTAARTRTAFTPVNGRHYRLVANKSTGTSYDVYNGKIVVDQTGTTLDPISQLQPQYLLINSTDSNATGLQAMKTLYDDSEWSGTQKFKFEIDSDNASNEASLTDTSSSTTVFGSKINGSNQQIAPPSYIQGKNASDGGSSGQHQEVTFDSNVTAGDLIVVAVGALSTTYPPAISDTQGNTYSLARSVTNASIPYKISIYYTVAGSTGALTVSHDSTENTQYRRIAVHEYAGVNTLDAVASNTGSSGVPSSGSATTAYDEELIFGWGISNGGITTPGASFTARQLVGSELTEDKLGLVAGSYSAIYPTDATAWAVAMATFYKSGGTGFSLTTGHDIDVNVTNTTGTISAARIIVDDTLPSSIVSVSVSNGSISYGTLATGSSKSTTSSGIDNTQTATNNGNVAEDLSIKGQNSANWTLASSSAADQYKHEYCTSGSGSPDPCDSSPTWTALTTSYQSLANNLAVNGTQKFDLNLTMPTSSISTAQQSVDVTILAVQH